MTYLTKSMNDSRRKSNLKQIAKKRANVPKFIKREIMQPKRPNEASKPFKKIKPLSDKRAAQNREYLKLRTQFLKEHPNCAVFPHRKAVEIHHMAGKTGKLLTEIKYFLPVSRAAHLLIEAAPKWAKDKGYSVTRTNK